MDQQSAIEEIALIKRVIEESRECTINYGENVIVWGVLISIAIFASYGAIAIACGFLGLWIWVAMIGAGWIYSIVKGFRRRTVIENLGGKLLSYAWTSCGIAMTILGLPARFQEQLQTGLSHQFYRPSWAPVLPLQAWYKN